MAAKKKKEKVEVKAKVKGKPKGKRKAEAKGKDKGNGKGKAEAKAKPKGKGKGKGKGKAEAKAKGKPKAKGKGKTKPEAKGKGKRKGKAKAEAKRKGKPKAKDKAKAKARRARSDQIAIQMVKPKQLAALHVPDDEPTKTPARADKARAETAPLVAAHAARQRWERVAARLGLKKHVRAVAGWDGQGNPPLLTGFSFVRHVESDTRDLRCKATMRNLTQGVIVQREDDKLFLVGRGVAQTYLGVKLPHKDRANAGRRFLTPLEREVLGQPMG